MVQNSFFEYKMSRGDTITTHVNKVISMGNLLRDLGKPVQEDMLVAKIFCSLPPSYNSILAAWNNVPAAEQTVANLKIHLLQMENIMNLQEGDNQSDKAFFTRSGRSSSDNNSKDARAQKEKNKEYVKDLKSRTLCFNCGKPKHWRDECPEPPRKDHSRRTKDHKGKHSAHANVVISQECDSSNDEDECHESDCSDTSDSYAFMVQSSIKTSQALTKTSQALTVSKDRDTWFADSGATEHMTEHREWFTTFNVVPIGQWSVAVADDRDLWVLGTGNIDILLMINGR